MSDAIELWNGFVAAGIRDIGAIDDGVSNIRPDRISEPDQRERLSELSYRAFSIACQSLLLGDESIGQLAMACERCMDLLAGGLIAPEYAIPALASAAYTLRRAFDTLAVADRSGARTDLKPLEAARFELEATFPKTEISRSAVGMAAYHGEHRAGGMEAILRSAQAPDVPLAALTRSRTPHSSSAAPATSFMQPTPLADDQVDDIVSSPAPIDAIADPLSSNSWVPNVADDMVELFFDEVAERIEGLSLTLIDVEKRPGDHELLRSVFRDLHTIKGSSAMVGLSPMNAVAHVAEDLVGQLRDGERQVDGAIIDALLAALDTLRDIAELARTGQRLDFDLTPIIEHLRNPHGGSGHTVTAKEPRAHGSLRHANERHATTDSDGNLSLQTDLSRTNPSTGDVPLHSGASRQTIRVDFDKLDRLLNLVGELVLGRDDLRTALDSLSSVADALSSERILARRLIDVGRGLRLTSRGPTHAQKQILLSGKDGMRSQKRVLDSTLRDLGDEIGRVERVLIDITQDLDYATGKLDSVSDELREQVMKLRMVPIGGIFRKHHRTVRDLSASMGKKARLELVGEDTELDKLLVEALDEPLMHLVRNAVDHGIATPSGRAQQDKPAEGVIRLSAVHRGNQVVVQIADDGNGIDPAVLRKKALERDLLTREQVQQMDDQQVLDLIFLPGFSTATTVSQVSGRGVGMDVVRQTVITQLKGTIDIDATYGRGTTFTLKLPLTLAIIQVLLARTGGEVVAIPLDSVLRTIACAQRDIHVIQDREVITERNQQLPLIRLTAVLELDPTPHTDDSVIQVIVTELAGERYGLVCDHLLGKKEIVIKPLGDLLQNVPCAAGATLLGDRCALILDIPALIRRALRVGARHPLKMMSARQRSDAVLGKRTAHVLLVDDSDTVRESLRRLLTDAGYQCTTAMDGVEGMAAAMSFDFDLVSTDVMMPRMDGYEFTRRLRATEQYKDTPIVMVTTRGERIDRVRGFDAGVDDYITKPHDRQLLLRTVRTLLAHRSLADGALELRDDPSAIPTSPSPGSHS